MSKLKTIVTLLIIFAALLVGGVMSGIINFDVIKGKKPTLPPPTGIIYRAEKVDVTLLVELPPDTKVTSVWGDFMGTGNILVGDDKGRVWLLKFEN